MCSRLGGGGWGLGGPGQGTIPETTYFTFRGFKYLYVVVCRYSSLFAALLLLHDRSGRPSKWYFWVEKWMTVQKLGVGWLDPVRQNRETIACQQWPSDYWKKNPLVIYLLLIWKNRVKNRVKNRGLRTGSCLVGSTRRTSNTLLLA
jgi:hypothetical protein